MLGQHLDEQCLAEDDLVDRLVEELREPRHVHALLRAIEVDGALDLRSHHRLRVAAADPDRLADTGDAGAGDGELDVGRRRLDVLANARVNPLRHAATLAPTWRRPTPSSAA